MTKIFKNPCVPGLVQLDVRHYTLRVARNEGPGRRQLPHRESRETGSSGRPEGTATGFVPRGTSSDRRATGRTRGQATQSSWATGGWCSRSEGPRARRLREPGERDLPASEAVRLGNRAPAERTGPRPTGRKADERSEVGAPKDERGPSISYMEGPRSILADASLNRRSDTRDVRDSPTRNPQDGAARRCYRRRHDERGTSISLPRDDRGRSDDALTP